MVQSLWRGVMMLPRRCGTVAPSVVRDVVAQTAAEAGLLPTEIMSRARNYKIAHARQLAMYRIRSMEHPEGGPRYSLPAIGRAFGFDHTTVVHGVFAVEKRRAIHALKEAA